jgi:hypothetical protein
MKRKAHCQLQPAHVMSAAEAQKEIDNFLAAIESYVARAAEQPGLSFQEHLSNIRFSDGARFAVGTGRG